MAEVPVLQEQKPARRLTVQPDRPRHTHCSSTPHFPPPPGKRRSGGSRAGPLPHGVRCSVNGRSTSAKPPEVRGDCANASRGTGRSREAGLALVDRLPPGRRQPSPHGWVYGVSTKASPASRLQHAPPSANPQSPQNFDPRIQVSERAHASSNRLSISSSTLPCAASACLMPYSAQPLCGCSRRSSSYSVMALSYSPTSM